MVHNFTCAMFWKADDRNIGWAKNGKKKYKILMFTGPLVTILKRKRQTEARVSLQVELKGNMATLRKFTR